MIKTKLDGLARKDLLASLSSFKEEVSRLYVSLETNGEFYENPSFLQADAEDDKPEGATAMIVEQYSGNRVEEEAIDTAHDLHQFIGTLKITSKKRYQSAETSFDEAKSLAMQAFSNTALRIEDRVMASKLRIASRILGSLEDPEAAVHDCLLYLKELQDLPAVQSMFTVWLEQGFTSRLRAFFNQKKRNVMIESIQAIHRLLLNLAMEFTKMKMAASNWPTINIGSVTYHPILLNEEIMKEIEKRGHTKQIPWIWPFQKIMDYRICGVTSTGNILSTTSSEDDLHGLEITRPNGECFLFGVFLSKKYMCCFALDENDKVYIVTEIPSRNGNVQAQYKLLTFEVNGNAVAERSLDIFEKLMYPQMTVTLDGKLVIYCWRIKGMYICDNKDGEGDYKFPLPLKNVCPGDIEAPSFTV